MAKNNPPRISVNKLAEYIVSKGARQRNILHDQKNRTISGMYYAEATKATSLCLASNLEDVSSIERTIRVLEQKSASTAGALRRISANIDALESFEAMLDDIDLKGATAELGEHRPERLVMHGVNISVRPDIILRGIGRGGKKWLVELSCTFHARFRYRR